MNMAEYAYVISNVDRGMSPDGDSPSDRPIRTRPRLTRPFVGL